MYTSPIQLDPQPEGLALEEEMELLEGTSQVGIFVDREYVYVPSDASGYVDEFICQIDRYQDLWYILQDVNYNVIALTDSGGEVVRQHTFDPYGEILTAEDFDTHPGIKIGHQGLFFDRLEHSAPVGGLISMSAAVQLQPGVFGLYQARNRVLLPRYGRWAQADPIGSGMLTSVLFDRKHCLPLVAVDLPSLSMALMDGSNRFAFVKSDPLSRTDPLGLFGFVSGLMTGLNLFDMATGVLDQAHQGISLAEQFTSTTTDYAFEQMMMVEWALDWYASDRDLGLADERYAADISDATAKYAMAGSVSWAKKKMPRKWQRGFARHHIATHWGEQGRRFSVLFQKAGMDLNDIENVMYITKANHSGSHTNAYHDAVYKDISSAIDDAAEGLTDPSAILNARRNAVTNVLKKWEARINSNPGVMYR